MKNFLTSLTIVFAIGCQSDHTPLRPSGWGETAALNWASDLGEAAPKTTCLPNNTEYIGKTFVSDCSVNAFGHIHKLWCYYPQMKCVEILPYR